MATLKEQYRQEQARIERLLNRLKRQGFEIEYTIPQTPKRVTQQSIDRLKRVTISSLKGSATPKPPKATRIETTPHLRSPKTDLEVRKGRQHIRTNRNRNLTEAQREAARANIVKAREALNRNRTEAQREASRANIAKAREALKRKREEATQPIKKEIPNLGSQLFDNYMENIRYVASRPKASQEYQGAVMVEQMINELLTIFSKDQLAQIFDLLNYQGLGMQLQEWYENSKALRYFKNFMNGVKKFLPDNITQQTAQMFQSQMRQPLSNVASPKEYDRLMNIVDEIDELIYDIADIHDTNEKLRGEWSDITDPYDA